MLDKILGVMGGLPLGARDGTVLGYLEGLIDGDEVGKFEGF